MPKTGSQTALKSKGGRGMKKIAAIEGAEDVRMSPSGTDSGKSDGDAEESGEEGSTIMLDEVLDLLSRRWDRINGAQALKLLPRETKLQVLISIFRGLRGMNDGLNCQLFYWDFSLAFKNSGSLHFVYSKISNVGTDW